MSVRSFQHFRVDRRGVDRPGVSGGGKCNHFPGGYRVGVGLVAQKYEGEPWRGDIDGTSVARSITRNGHDLLFALQTTIGFEVRTKGLTGPRYIVLCRDFTRKEVLDPNGWRSAGRLASIAAADGDCDVQAVGSGWVIQEVEESYLRRSTVFVDGVARS